MMSRPPRKTGQFGSSENRERRLKEPSRADLSHAVTSTIARNARYSRES
jgi:hypothetical protein